MALRDPVRAMQAVSWDVNLTELVTLTDNRTATALELQWGLLEAAQKYLREQGTDAVGGPVADEVVERWENVLAGLESDPRSLVGQLDWITKRQVMDGFRERHGLSTADLKLAALDLQYHDLRPNRSLFARMGAETLVDADKVRWAMDNPPDDTRAYFRGQCLKRWPDRIVAANWDSMVFDVGGEALRRVPMMEPTRGTADHVGTLLDTCETVEELLDRLTG